MKGLLLKGQREVSGELNDETEGKRFETCSGIFRSNREHTAHGNDSGCARVLKYNNAKNPFQWMFEMLDDEIAVVKT